MKGWGEREQIEIHGSKRTYILLLQYNLSKAFSWDLEHLLQLIEIPKFSAFHYCRALERNALS